MCSSIDKEILRRMENRSSAVIKSSRAQCEGFNARAKGTVSYVMQPLDASKKRAREKQNKAHIFEKKKKIKMPVNSTLISRFFFVTIYFKSSTYFFFL